METVVLHKYRSGLKDIYYVADIMLNTKHNGP